MTSESDAEPGRARPAVRAARLAAGVEAVRDGVAIVAPDGTVEYANRMFAGRFGRDRDAIVGAPWRDLFPDEEVRRLRSDAFPGVEDGWRWTGECVGRRPDGERFTARTGVVGLDAGGFALVVYEPGE